MKLRFPPALALVPLLVTALWLVPALPAWGSDVTTPSEHLDRPLGVDFDLADWDEVSSYYKLLGDQSPRVITEVVGETTEGREFLIMIISSEENLENLEEIKAKARRIADPRGLSDDEKQQAIEDGKVILFISCQMHSTESAGSQFSMELAHALATSDEEPWASAREKMVTVIYTTNPDGIDHVTKWYREHVGTEFEATGLLELYQYYTGHDNNRDWFMLTQKETQIVSRLLYKEWFPVVYWDVHEQGSNAERFFVPPYRDPLNPNLDPGIITGIGAIGGRAMMDMTREGFTGISTGVSYDMWWNGGNRNVPVRHNIIGILTEAAGVDIATPLFFRQTSLRAPRGLPGYQPSNQFPNPWPGGWWRLADIIDYEMAFARSLLGTLTREPQTWLRNKMEAAERAIAAGETGTPRAWIIPADNRDPDAVERLIDILIQTGVEVHVSDSPVEADGRPYPAGSIVIRRDQPYGTHVKDLFDLQRYPDGPPPYDVSGWTLPLLMGVRRVEVMHGLDEEIELREVDSPREAVAAFAGDERLEDADGALSTRHSAAWRQIVASLDNGNDLAFVANGGRSGLIVRGDGDNDAVPLNGMPRIGIYAPWSGSMDEGWIRWVFDTWEIPFTRVRNEMIRAGDLADFIDVLIIPDIGAGQLDRGRREGTVPEQYARGLDPDGAVAIEEFVRGGGRLITFASSSQWAIDLFALPLIDVTNLRDNREFSCPGSVLRGVPVEDSVFTADLPDSMPLFFSRSAAYREMTDAERTERGVPRRADQRIEMNTLLRYAPERVLLSGWINQPQVIESRAAWIHCRVGEGSIHVFGFRPHYRGWTHGTFPLLFRAMLLEE